jgi:hypothetical protein
VDSQKTIRIEARQNRALGGFADPEYCRGAYRALATGGGSAIFESDFFGVVNVSMVTAL